MTQTKAKNQKFPSGFPTWVTGTQVLEQSSVDPRLCTSRKLESTKPFQNGMQAAQPSTSTLTIFLTLLHQYKHYTQVTVILLQHPFPTSSRTYLFERQNDRETGQHQNTGLLLKCPQQPRLKLKARNHILVSIWGQEPKYFGQLPLLCQEQWQEVLSEVGQPRLQSRQ